MAQRSFQMALLCCGFACSPALAAGQTADAPAPPPAAIDSAQAQASGPPAAADATTPAASGAVIAKGTVVVVELTEALSSTKSKSGDRFGLRLAEPMMIGDAVIVPAGVTGVGEVIDAKPAGIGGRPGRLVLAAHYLESGGLRLNLQSFKLGGGGQDNSSVAVGAAVVVGLVGVLIPGGGVEYPAGTRATAKIASDTMTASAVPAGVHSPDPTSSH